MTVNSISVRRISLEPQPFLESGLFFSRSNRWIRPTRPNGRLLPARRPLTPLPRLRHNIFDVGADASEAPVTLAHCLILTPKWVAGTAVGIPGTARRVRPPGDRS